MSKTTQILIAVTIKNATRDLLILRKVLLVRMMFVVSLTGGNSKICPFWNFLKCLPNLGIQYKMERKKKTIQQY
jgi:hypothetical protein